MGPIARDLVPRIARAVRGFELVIAVVGWVVSLAQPAAASPLSNGGFESAPGFPTVSGPDTTSITDWGVYDGQVHIAKIGAFAPKAGERSQANCGALDTGALQHRRGERFCGGL